MCCKNHINSWLRHLVIRGGVSITKSDAISSYHEQFPTTQTSAKALSNTEATSCWCNTQSIIDSLRKNRSGEIIRHKRLQVAFNKLLGTCIYYKLLGIRTRRFDYEKANTSQERISFHENRYVKLSLISALSFYCKCLLLSTSYFTIGAESVLINIPCALIISAFINQNTAIAKYKWKRNIYGYWLILCCDEHANRKSPPIKLNVTVSSRYPIGTAWLTAKC